MLFNLHVNSSRRIRFPEEGRLFNLTRTPRIRNAFQDAVKINDTSVAMIKLFQAKPNIKR